MSGHSPSPSAGATCRTRRITPSLTAMCVLALCAVLIAPADGQGMRLCGQKLTRTLQAVCSKGLCGGFAESSINKRAFEPRAFDEYALNYLKHPHLTIDTAYPADAAQEIESYKRMDETPAWMNNLRKRDGIATQCCERKCTYAYLKTFCCEN